MNKESILVSIIPCVVVLVIISLPIFTFLYLGNGSESNSPIKFCEDNGMVFVRENSRSMNTYCMDVNGDLHEIFLDENREYILIERNVGCGEQ